MRPTILGLLGALVTATSLCVVAHAQDSREAIMQRDQMLYQQHQQQQSNQGGGSMIPVAPPPGAPPAGPGQYGQGQYGQGQPGQEGLTPQLLDRISTLEAQVRELRGQLDQLTNQVQQQNAALAKQVGDLGFAVQNTSAPSRAAAAPAGPGRVAPPPPPGRLAPAAAVAQGQRALARRDYQTAAADARQALSVRGAHQADAQFLLAQSLAGQRQYQQAATAYYDAYSRAQRSPRGADALLGVSASLLALGDRTDACQALQKLRVEFPAATARQRSAAATLHGRAVCR